MARISLKEKEFFAAFDRLPDAEGRIMEMVSRAARPIGFYRFERVEVSPVEDARLWASFSKASQGAERLPIFCRSKGEGEWMLRMSGALALIRFGMTHRLYNEASPAKLWWEGDCFWREGTGRDDGVRRSYEIALATIGQDDPLAVAEIMMVLWRSFGELGIRDEDLSVRVNAVGCGVCRAAFRSAMTAYLRPRSGRLCKVCRVGARRAPVRLAACSDERCRAIIENAPQMLDFLCDSCGRHLRTLFECFDEARLPYFLDSTLYREESFFSDIIFEFRYKAAHGEDSDAGEGPGSVVLAEGGRMSRVGKAMTGKRFGAVAGVILLDNALDAAVAAAPEAPRHSPVFVVQLGELAKRKSLVLVERLREGGIPMFASFGRDSIRAQLKAAERAGTNLALVLGQKEALDGTVIVREVMSGIQETVRQDKIVDFLKERVMGK
ncbi:MAG: His/Gly/Thr/Pro-type tRNA ligase C-terminal domain-containing protein [Patescibacteria group bacterium]